MIVGIENDRLRCQSCGNEWEPIEIGFVPRACPSCACCAICASRGQPSRTHYAAKHPEVEYAR